MENHAIQMPPSEARNLDSRRRRLLAFWREFGESDNLGGTCREALEEIRAQVDEFMARGQPADFRQAERLTSKAMYIIEFGAS